MVWSSKDKVRAAPNRIVHRAREARWALARLTCLKCRIRWRLRMVRQEYRMFMRRKDQVGAMPRRQFLRDLGMAGFGGAGFVYAGPEVFGLSENGLACRGPA